MINYEPLSKKPLTPKVGVGVFLWRVNDLAEFQILLGKRKGSHGEGEWGLPSGHMELGEEFKTTCIREVEEETGIKIYDINKVGFTNDHFPNEGLHYVTLFFAAKWDRKQEPKLMEPESCYEWQWFNISYLPENLWESVKIILSDHCLV